jgi:alpha-1,3-rhamnosyl/mannosyltransferase
VVTLYDVIPRLFPHEVSPRARLLFDLLSRAAIRAADAVIAISESARDDIARAYDVPRQRFAVTPLAADARFRPQPEGSLDTVRRRHDLPQHYVLCVSSSKPHKNLPALVEAWARLTDEERGGCSLVLAGHFDPRSLKEQRLTEHSAAEGTVHVLPDLAEADLPALYAGAKLFVFPSRYEGFGLPPLEAMACGAPVICGPTSSLPEVVGDAGLVVDVTQPAALAAGIARALADPQLRSRMREQGLTRAASFSWRRTAELTLQVYEGAASARAG